MTAFTRVSRIVSTFRHMAAPNCQVVRRQSLASYHAEFSVWPRVAPSTSLSSVSDNRRFPEITGEDNLTVFSYSGRVKSPEWRWQRRRAGLRHFEIFRHGPIIIYTRLSAGGTYYPICTFPASSECLIGISDAFSAFCLRVSVILPTCSLYPQQKRAYSALHPHAWTYIYIHVHARQLLPSAVPWISEDRLLWTV